jgi:hypothetical protein
MENMATINRTPGSGNQNFKQIEATAGEHLSPVICAGTVIAVVLLVASP